MNRKKQSHRKSLWDLPRNRKNAAVTGIKAMDRTVKSIRQSHNRQKSRQIVPPPQRRSRDTTGTITVVTVPKTDLPTKLNK